LSVTTHSQAPDAEQARQPVSPAGDVRALVGAGIFSANAPALAAFYGMLLGVRFEHRVHTNGCDHRIAKIASLHFEIKATHTAGGARTLDAPAEVAGGVDATSSIELSFSVPDARASYDYALTLSASPFISVEDYAWGAFGTVLDPDGNRVGLYSIAARTDSNTETDTSLSTNDEGDR